MSRVFRNKTGLTLIELLLAVVLLSVVSLAVFSLYNLSQVFYLASNDDVIISYELEYAVQHIYKNVMRAIGDESSPPIDVSVEETLSININNNALLTQDNYDDIVTYTYYKSEDELMFNDGVNPEESLVPKVKVTAVDFALDEDILTISLTGEYANQTLTFYSAVYPRLASFN